MTQAATWGSIALVVAMMVTAGLFGSKDIIFPEIAALAFGAWVLDTRPWPGPAWTMWFSPTVGAVTGVLLLRFVPASLAVLVCLAFVLVLFELQVSRSSISPTFSAAVLPIITNIHGWLYPASVCLMTALIAGVTMLKEHTAVSDGGTARPVCRFARDCLPHTLASYGKLTLCVLVAAVVAMHFAWTFILAPPLLVAFVELAQPECPWRGQGVRLILLLTASALAGTIGVAGIVLFLSGPPWLAAALAVAAVFGLVRLLQLASPPAFALALLPTILPPAILPTYPLQVLIGSLLFLWGVKLWFPVAVVRER